MIPLCFFSSSPNHRKSSSSSSSEMPQNLITCIYQTQLCNSLPPSYLTLTWSKSRHSHSLTIHAPDFFSITISLYPNTTLTTTFPFNLFYFRARSGSKSVFLTDQGKKLKLFWDFTRAQFNPNSAEPESNFYISITSNSRVEFFLGDLFDDFTRRSSSSSSSGLGFGNNLLLSRREHVFGGRNNYYVSRAEVMGSKHEFAVELLSSSGGGGVLKVKIDGEMKLVVKRLAWKFRGNERIIISGGVEVEFYWDVFNWVVKNNKNDGHGNYGVFVFQIGGSNNGVWPEMVGAEKKLMMRKSNFLSSSSSAAGGGKIAPAMMMMSSVSSSSPSTTCSSVLQWAEESSDCGRSSCSSTRSSYGIGGGGGFSLLLYAWRKD